MSILFTARGLNHRIIHGGKKMKIQFMAFLSRMNSYPLFIDMNY